MQPKEPELARGPPWSPLQWESSPNRTMDRSAPSDWILYWLPIRNTNNNKAPLDKFFYFRLPNQDIARVRVEIGDLPLGLRRSRLPVLRPAALHQTGAFGSATSGPKNSAHAGECSHYEQQEEQLYLLSE